MGEKIEVKTAVTSTTEALIEHARETGMSLAEVLGSLEMVKDACKAEFEAD